MCISMKHDIYQPVYQINAAEPKEIKDQGDSDNRSGYAVSAFN